MQSPAQYSHCLWLYKCPAFESPSNFLQDRRRWIYDLKRKLVWEKGQPVHYQIHALSSRRAVDSWPKFLPQLLRSIWLWKSEDRSYPIHQPRKASFPEVLGTWHGSHEPGRFRFARKHFLILLQQALAVHDLGLSFLFFGCCLVYHSKKSRRGHASW